MYKQTENNWEKIKNEKREAETLAALGESYLASNTKRAIENLERSLILFERHYEKHDFKIINNLLNLATAYFDTGNREKSKNSFIRALSIFKKHFATFGLSYEVDTFIEKAIILEKNYHKNEVQCLEQNIDTLSNIPMDKNMQMTFFKSCLPIYKKHYGMEHEYTKKLMQEIDADKSSAPRDSSSKKLKLLGIFSETTKNKDLEQKNKFLPYKLRIPFYGRSN